MGVEINRLTTSPSPHSHSYRSLSDDYSSPAPSPTFLRIHHNPDRNDPDDSFDSSTGETAGIYLGILNLFATLPQFVGTFISMLVFFILEPGRSPELHKAIPEVGVDKSEVAGKTAQATDGPNAIAVCLFIGALSAVGAAYATKRMKMTR